VGLDYSYRGGDAGIEQSRQGWKRCASWSPGREFVLTISVLYLGVSDTPAWVITKANQYARDHGLAQFVGLEYLTFLSSLTTQVLYQGRWSVKDRDLERELLPMCISEGMGIAPWGAIGQGSFQRKADQGKSKDGRSAKELSEDEKKVSAALEKVADELKIESVTAVALAWCMSKYPYVYPIIGGRKIEYVLHVPIRR
jgi:aryl-alcohol dehydrogenase-like predicted oxidoreductase